MKINKKVYDREYAKSLEAWRGVDLDVLVMHQRTVKKWMMAKSDFGDDIGYSIYTAQFDVFVCLVMISLEPDICDIIEEEANGWLGS